MEELSLNSWGRLCQYNGFRELLGTGMNTHLQHNDLLRDVFQMGPPPLQVSTPSKASRLERVSCSPIHPDLFDVIGALLLEIHERCYSQAQDTVQRQAARQTCSLVITPSHHQFIASIEIYLFSPALVLAYMHLFSTVIIIYHR